MDPKDRVDDPKDRIDLEALEVERAELVETLLDGMENASEAPPPLPFPPTGEKGWG